MAESLRWKRNGRAPEAASSQPGQTPRQEMARSSDFTCFSTASCNFWGVTGREEKQSSSATYGSRIDARYATQQQFYTSRVTIIIISRYSSRNRRNSLVGRVQSCLSFVIFWTYFHSSSVQHKTINGKMLRMFYGWKGKDKKINGIFSQGIEWRSYLVL